MITDIKSLIKTHFVDSVSSRGKIQKFLKYKNEIKTLTSFLPEKTKLAARLYYIFYDLSEPIRCISCGKIILQDKFFQKHYCSVSCQTSGRLFDVQKEHSYDYDKLKRVLLNNKETLHIKENIYSNNLIRLYKEKFYWCQTLLEAKYCVENDITEPPTCLICNEKLKYYSLVFYGAYCEKHKINKAIEQFSKSYQIKSKNEVIHDLDSVRKTINELLLNKNNTGNKDFLSRELVRLGFKYSLLQHTQFLTGLNRSRKNDSLSERIYCVLNEIDCLEKLPKCVSCGKPAGFVSFNKGHSRCCSNKCSKQLIGLDWKAKSVEEKEMINSKRKLKWTLKSDKEKDEIIEKIFVSRSRSNLSSKSADYFFDLVGLILEEFGVERSEYNSNVNCGEKRVGRYSLDFCYKNKVIEFYGDNVHGNPKKYKKGDFLPYYGKILVDNKWKSDEKRIDFITSLGYETKIVWASDCRLNPTTTLEECKNFLLNV